MKTILYDGGAFVIAQAPDAAAAPGQVLVRVSHALPDSRLSLPGKTACGGIVGTVAAAGYGFAAGEAVTALPYALSGERCNCDATVLLPLCGELAAVPAGSLVRVPADDPKYALTAALAGALTALRRSELGFNRRVLISGSTPFAILLGLLVRRNGTLRMAFVAEDAERAEVLRAYGFDAYDQPSVADWKDFGAQHADQVGFDFLYDTTGSAETILALVGAARRGSLLTITAIPAAPVEFHIATAIRNQVSFLGSRLPSWDDFDRALTLLRDGFPLDGLDRLLGSPDIRQL